MKCLKIAGLAFASMLLASMALTGSAAATPTWLLCLEGSNASNTKYEDSSCTKALSTGKWESVEIGSKTVSVRIVPQTILLLDTGATGGSSGVRCGGGGKTIGSAIAEGNKLIVREQKFPSPKSECERVEGGCKAGEVEKLEAVNLPWKAEFFETEGAFVDKVLGDGNGEPGWAIECNTLLGKQSDTCTFEAGAPEEAMAQSTRSTLLLLLLTFLLGRRMGHCTQGGNNVFLDLGRLLWLLFTGWGFSLR